MCFADVSCPSWADDTQCVDTAENYELRVQIVGGDRDATIDFCVDGILPS